MEDTTGLVFIQEDMVQKYSLLSDNPSLTALLLEKLNGMDSMIFIVTFNGLDIVVY